jgi:hypothetical protein
MKNSGYAPAFSTPFGFMGRHKHAVGNSSPNNGFTDTVGTLQNNEHTKAVNRT